jgi:alkylation response protein AidB-like acyl-CoA dehydrogenase
MDFELTAEQEDLQRLCRRFAREEIDPHVREHAETEWAGDPEERFPVELWERFEEVGLRAMNVPERYGGDDFSPGVLTQCLLFEELATPDIAIITAISNNWKLPKLLKKLPESVQDEWFPRLLEDPSFSMAQALTEPRGASDRWLPHDDPDVTLDTTAERDGDEWIIDGTKRFITGGYHADLYFTYVNTDPSVGMLDGTSLFLVPRDRPGVEVVRENETVGHRWDCNGEIHFSSVRVPEEHLIFRDSALSDIGDVFEGFRTKTAAKILGAGRGALEEALEYAKSREQGGGPIVDHQIIKDRIAQMGVELESARSTIWRAAAAADAERNNATRLGIIARLHAADAAFDIARHAVEIHGGTGSMRAARVERYLRDATTSLHLFGTQDIHKLKLADAIAERSDPGTPR